MPKYTIKHLEYYLSLGLVPLDLEIQMLILWKIFNFNLQLMD